MSHTVAEYKESVSAILSNLDLNNIADLNPTLERAVTNLIERADIPEASGIQNITLYSNVYDYPISTKIFGTKVVDIAPQGVSRAVWDGVTKTNQQNFDRTKGYLANGTRFTFKYLDGNPVIRIATQNTTPSVNINQCSEIGTWIAAGSASGLTVDTANYYQQPASLRFTLTGSSLGTLTNNLTNASNLSTYQGVGVVFLAVYIPDATTLTSVSLKLGSSASDYSEVTSTQGFLGTWTSNDWQLVAFDMSTASSTGTPNWSAIDYVQVGFNHTATQTNFRVGSLFIAQPSPNQIFYYSNAIFTPTGSTTALKTITDDTDTVILNDSAYTIYLYEGALALLENTSGGMGDPMYKRIQEKLNGNGGQIKGLYSQYQGSNPSQEVRTLGSYYGTQNNWGYNSSRGF